jgi:hypothetical protein
LKKKKARAGVVVRAQALASPARAKTVRRMVVLSRLVGAGKTRMATVWFKADLQLLRLS